MESINYKLNQVNNFLIRNQSRINPFLSYIEIKTKFNSLRNNLNLYNIQEVSTEIENHKLIKYIHDYFEDAINWIKDEFNRLTNKELKNIHVRDIIEL